MCRLRYHSCILNKSEGSPANSLLNISAYLRIIGMRFVWRGHYALSLA